MDSFIFQALSEIEATEHVLRTAPKHLDGVVLHNCQTGAWLELYRVEGKQVFWE